MHGGVDPISSPPCACVFLDLHFSMGDAEPWETKYFGFFLHFGALLLPQIKTEAFV